MPTLAEDLQQLLMVQAVDTRLDRARSEQAHLDTGAALAAAYNTGKVAFERLKTTAIHAQGTQQDAELRLQSIETKAEDVMNKMYGGKVTGARELSDLQKESEMLVRQKGDAEEKVLAAMEVAGEVVAHAQTAEAELVGFAEQYKKVRATYKERTGALDTEIAAMVKEREATAKPVTPSLLARYDALRARRAGVGISVLSADSSCGACHTSVSSGIVADTIALKTPQTCEHCGRLLAPPLHAV